MKFATLKNRISALLLAASIMLAAGTKGEAALKAAGPVEANTGLPAYYQDTKGITLAPCLETNGFCVLPPLFDPALTKPPTLLTIIPGPAPIHTPQNFPSEVFYFLCDVAADMGPNGTARFALRTALEGAFSPVVADGNQVTFIKITMQPMSGLKPNSTYTVNHPYGTFTFSTYSSGSTRPGQGNQVFRKQDGCGTAPCAFTELLPATATNLGPFLRAAPPFPSMVTDPKGNVYIGNPVQGVAVVGSPVGNNRVVITGPDIGGTAIDTVTLTDGFHLSGKLVLIAFDKPAVAFPAQRPGINTAPVQVTVSNFDPVNSLTIGTLALGGANGVEFALTPGADQCSGKVLGAASATGSSCTFSLNFIGAAPDGTRTATVTVPAKTADGSVISGTVNLTGVVDTTRPTVSFSIPADGAVNTPINNSIAVTFSKPVQGVDGTTFLLSTGGITVPGTVSFDAASNTAIFAPSANLLVNTGYTVTLTSGITDTLGNILAPNFNFGFVTGPLLAPAPQTKVVSFTPANNASKIPKNTVITVTFNEPVDPATVNASTFILSNGVTGAVTYDPRTRIATFTPDKPLAFDKAYTATVKAGIRSLGNAATAADTTWTFLTNGTPTAPKLFAPADTQKVTGTTAVDLQWIKSTDTDTEAVTYHVYYSTDPSMVGCVQVDATAATVTSAKTAGSSFLAGFGGYGGGMLLVGFTVAGGVRSRRKVFYLVALVLVAGMTATACGSKGGSSTAASPAAPAPLPAGLVTKGISGLQPGTTYWWKVVADDGNGGTAESETWSFTTKTPPPVTASGK